MGERSIKKVSTTDLEFENKFRKNREHLIKLLTFRSDNAEGLADDLLKKFGSLSGVFGAAESELMKIKGMSSELACFLHDFPEICRAYLEDEISPGVRIFNSESAYTYIKNKFYGCKSEVVVLMILNSRGQILYNNIVTEGSMSMVPVYIKEVIKLCIECNADTVIIAHNHPSGSPVPSKSDIRATKELQLALESIYVTLYDHIVIANDNHFSMRSAGWLKEITKTTDEFRGLVLELE